MKAGKEAVVIVMLIKVRHLYIKVVQMGVVAQCLVQEQPANISHHNYNNMWGPLASGSQHPHLRVGGFRFWLHSQLEPPHNEPGETVEDGPRSWVPATHAEDLEGAPGS